VRSLRRSLLARYFLYLLRELDSYAERKYQDVNFIKGRYSGPGSLFFYHALKNFPGRFMT
jgi:hypothetical protein